MKIQLLSCDAIRPDQRAITKMLEEISSGVGNSEARELASILIDGTPIDIEVTSNTSSAFRALRKLAIDYEIQD